MPNFIEEISKLFNLPIDNVLAGYKIFLLGESCAIIEGRIKLVHAAEDEMCFTTARRVGSASGRKLVRVLGSGLKINTLDKNFVSLTGSITKIEL